MTIDIHTDPATIVVRAALRGGSPEVIKAARLVGRHLEALFRAYEDGTPLDDKMSVVAGLLFAIDVNAPPYRLATSTAAPEVGDRR